MIKRFSIVNQKYLLLVSLIFLLSLFLISCDKVTPSDELIHVHSVSFDPTQKNVYYIGTHKTLEKYDGFKTETIGKLESDFMGFIITGNGDFFSSGHSKTEANLGIRISIDKGKNWKEIAFSGLDFHDMTTSYVNPDSIYALSTSPNEFLTFSNDAGKSWSKIDSELKINIFSLAADHQIKNKLYAGTLFGLFISDDGGNVWNSLESLVNISILAVADDPINEEVVYVSAYKKGILKTENNGKTWQEINKGLSLDNNDIVLNLAVNPFDSKELVIVTKNNLFYKYDGESWYLENVFPKKK